MEVVAGQPIKKFKFFRIPQSLYWRPSADQKARGLWVRDWRRAAKDPATIIEWRGHWNFRDSGVQHLRNYIDLDSRMKWTVDYRE